MTSHRRDRGERDTLAVLRGQVWQCFTYIRCSADLRYSCVCVKDVEGLTVYACIACAFYLKVGSFVASLFVHTCIQGTLWLFRWRGSDTKAFSSCSVLLIDKNVILSFYSESNRYVKYGCLIELCLCVVAWPGRLPLTVRDGPVCCRESERDYCIYSSILSGHLVRTRAGQGRQPLSSGVGTTQPAIETISWATWQSEAR